MQKQILGVKIDDVSLEEASKIIEGWFKESGKKYIVTPNPEFLVEAQKNAEFRETLNSADLAIPDGIGLKLAGVKNRLAGVDLMEELIQFALKRGLSVGLLGGRKKVAEALGERLSREYPKLKISIANSLEEFDGAPVGNTPHWLSNASVLRPAGPDSDTLVASSSSRDRGAAGSPPSAIPKTDILFVALGAPKQEKWIAENLNKIPVKVAMGVGGSFDYLAGRVPRAPKFLRSLGLEWLFRLAVQPWRIKRQLRLLQYLYLLLFERK